MHSRAALLAGWLLFLTSLLGATEPLLQQAPQFRAGVDLVRLQVSVLDRNRRPVRGLKAEDFTLREDGRVQPIAAFAEVGVPESELPLTAWTRTLAHDVCTNAPLDGRLILVIMDDAMVPFDVAAVETSKAVARSVIDKLGPSDMAAIVFTLDNRHAQDFTNDRSRLLRAVDTFTAKFQTFDSLTDWYYRHASMMTVRRAAESLATEPQRLRAIVYISVGAGGGSGLVQPPVIGSGSVAADDARFAAFDAVRDSLVQVQAANVSVYAVDPSGLGGLAAFLQRRSGPTGRPVSQAAAETQANFYRSALERMSEQSGGFAVIKTNDFEPGVEQIFRENSTYYVIGYRPAEITGVSRLQKIEIGVKKPGLFVRGKVAYRRPLLANNNAPGSATASRTTAGILPDSSFPLSIQLAPFASKEADTATLAVSVGIGVPSLEGGSRITEELELQGQVFTPEGNDRGSWTQKVVAVFSPHRDTESRFDILSRLNLRPGRYSLRVGVRNATRDASGSVYCDVEIPDFRRNSVSLSGLVVSLPESVDAAPQDLLLDLVPLPPRTVRTFAVGDAATVFFRVYQADARTVDGTTVTIRIFDSAGRDVIQDTRRLDPAAFSPERAVDIRFPLPTATLRAGEYQLAVQASIAAVSVHRQLRFTIK